MPSLLLRGCYVRHFTVQDDESGVFVRADFTAQFSEPAREAMGWGLPDDSTKMAKLTGELIGRHLILTPNGELKKNEIQFGVNEISDFEFHRVKDGESTRTELRFKVRSSEEGVGAALEAYKRRILKGEAAAKIVYEKQGELDLEKEASADGDKPERSAGPAIASQREMSQSKKKPN